MEQNHSKTLHMPQLDGLRALAVLAVVWFHWIPGAIKPLGVSLGEMGVNLFFVLSGFLITGILLDNVRARSEENFHVLRQFYFRRLLRIFPLYYATIFLLVLLNIPPFREAFGWHLLYLQNFYQWKHGAGIWGSHLWTLAVEEQFYILWPFFVLFTPGKWLPVLLPLAILIGPLFRFVCWKNGMPDEVVRLLPAAVDTLVLGASMALVVRSAGSHLVRKLAFLALVTGGSLLVLIHLTDILVLKAFRTTAVGLVFTWLIWRASIGFRGVIGRLLECGPATYLGKISYGVYVIHGFPGAIWNWFFYSAPVPGHRIFDYLGLPHNLMDSLWIHLGWNLVFTTVLSILSWKYFEAPINSLKRFFPYSKEKRSVTV